MISGLVIKAVEIACFDAEFPLLKLSSWMHDPSSQIDMLQVGVDIVLLTRKEYMDLVYSGCE